MQTIAALIVLTIALPLLYWNLSWLRREIARRHTPQASPEAYAAHLREVTELLLFHYQRSGVGPEAMAGLRVTLKRAPLDPWPRYPLLQVHALTAHGTAFARLIPADPRHSGNLRTHLAGARQTWEQVKAIRVHLFGDLPPDTFHSLFETQDRISAQATHATLSGHRRIALTRRFARIETPGSGGGA